jgi:hypothetical protein
MQKIYFGLSFALAGAAAFIYRCGWEEIAATAWFVSLILLMPVIHKQA